MPEPSADHEPFRPPSVATEEAVEQSRELADWERRAFEMYLRHRHESFRPGLLTLQAIPSMLFLTAIISGPPFVGGWLLDNREWMLNVLLVAGGFLAGYFLCILGFYRQFARLWPVLRTCFNWPRIETLISNGPAKNAEPVDAVSRDAIPVEPIAEPPSESTES